jgi:hypothetical protein
MEWQIGNYGSNGTPPENDTKNEPPLFGELGFILTWWTNQPLGGVSNIAQLGGCHLRQSCLQETWEIKS